MEQETNTSYEYEKQSVAVLVNPDHKVLLIQKKETEEGSLQWVFPVVVLEEGEDFLQAVIRGVQEKLGINVPIEQCTELHRVTMEDMEVEQVAYVCLIDFVKDITVHESAGVAWFGIDELHTMDIGLRGDVNTVPVVEKLLGALKEKSES